MSCHAQLWLDQIVPSILQVERLNETINILAQINTEYYNLLQCWCSYLNFVLSKIRSLHFSFSKNYLNAKGAHNSFRWVANSRGIPGSCNYSVRWLCFILCSPKLFFFFFFSTYVKVFIFARFLTVQWKYSFLWLLCLQVCKYKGFCFNFISG